MSRLELSTPTKAQLVVEGLYKDLERRIESSPPGLCPVDLSAHFWIFVMHRPVGNAFLAASDWDN